MVVFYIWDHPIKLTVLILPLIKTMEMKELFMLNRILLQHLSNVILLTTQQKKMEEFFSLKRITKLTLII